VDFELTLVGLERARRPTACSDPGFNQEKANRTPATGVRLSTRVGSDRGMAEKYAAKVPRTLLRHGAGSVLRCPTESSNGPRSNCG
jgi:hypothetical protein